MTKNNHDIRANTLQRVDQLEKLVAVFMDGVEEMTKVDNGLLKMIDELRPAVRSLEAQVAHLETQLAAHQMDTLLARIKRLWRP